MRMVFVLPHGSPVATIWVFVEAITSKAGVRFDCQVILVEYALLESSLDARLVAQHGCTRYPEKIIFAKIS